MKTHLPKDMHVDWGEIVREGAAVTRQRRDGVGIRGAWKVVIENEDVALSHIATKSALLPLQPANVVRQ